MFTETKRLVAIALKTNRKLLDGIHTLHSKFFGRIEEGLYVPDKSGFSPSPWPLNQVSILVSKSGIFLQKVIIIEQARRKK
jgi:hypothetical protein